MSDTIGSTSDGHNTAAGTKSSGRYPIFRTIVFSLLALLALGGIAAFVIISNQEPETKRRPFTPLGVQASYARLDTVQLTIQTQGEARPRTQIDFVPQVGGKIVYVSPNFVEGGIIRKGETLVRIDPSDFNVAVIRAEAQVAQAEQVLTQETAEGEIARRDYAELGRGAPSPLALREPQRRQAEAGLQAAKADLENAKLQLTRTSVRAPFDGRVRVKSSDIGQFVSPGARLGQIFSTNIVEVRLPLTDADLGKIDLPIAYVAKSRAAAPVVTLSTTIGGKMQNWEGRIMRTDAVYDTQSRALFAIAEVFDPYGAGASENGVPIAPGLFVDARIGGKKLENVIVIPRDGLRVDDEIYVVDNKGKAEIRSVSVLDTNPARAVLSSGIKAGELVILSPMERSRVSLPLKVLDASDPTKVLVEPEEPAWMKKANEEAGKKADGKKGRKGKRDKDTETSDDAPADDGDKSSESEGASE